MAHCPAVDVPEDQQLWIYCPSKAGAYVMTIVFALTTFAHIAQAFIHRKPYTMVIIIAGILQTLSYIMRILSIENPTSLGFYAISLVLVLIAPIFTNAFVYMVMGRMAWNFTSKAKIGGVRPWRLGLIFVLLDILSFFIQIIGGIKAANPKSSTETGFHIYMAGIAIQQLFLIIFFIFALSFHRIMNAEGGKPKKAYALLYTVYLALLCITIRVIFRLCEFAEGSKSPTIDHEIYQYLLDSLPMLVALIAFNIIHPGAVMPGRAGNLPSRKERRNGLLTKNAQNPEMTSSEQLDFSEIPSVPNGEYRG